MSVMFAAQVEKHLIRLKAQLESSDTDHLKKELKELQDAHDIVSDARVKRSLASGLDRIKARLDSSSDTDDLKERIRAIEGVQKLIQSHPDYNSKGKTPKRKKK